MSGARSAFGMPWHHVAGAIFVGLALRVVAGLALNVDDGLQRGFNFYGFLADSVVEGRGYHWHFYNGLGIKWANRPPLYPLLLAAVRWCAGGHAAIPAVVVQSCVGAFACLLPAALAVRWGGSRAGGVALWLAALWPYSILIDTGMVEHVVFAPFVVMSVLLWLRAADGRRARTAVAAGVAAGLAVLARATFPVAAFCIGVARLRDRRCWTAMALFAAGAALVLSPWILRNHAATGSWVLGTDGGRALWLSNAGGTFDHYPERSIDDSENAVFAALTDAERAELRRHNADEVAQDAVFAAWAREEIASRPGHHAWGALRKSAALWSPVVNPGPAGALKSTVFAVSLVAMLALCVAAFATLPRLRADLPVCVALAVGFTIPAAVFWGQSRYLAPAHGVALAAAAAWVGARKGLPQVGGART
jgi:hypothetical protein